MAAQTETRAADTMAGRTAAVKEQLLAGELASLRVDKKVETTAEYSESRTAGQWDYVKGGTMAAP